MATVYYDDDADLSLIQGRKIAVLGYGSQGHAHALSLRDSGCEVQVGLPEGSRSRKRAEAEGLTVATPAEACAWADVIMVLTPDTTQRKLYADDIAPHLKAGRRAVLRARLQHPLRLHHRARTGGRGHGRAQGAGPHRAPPVRGRARAPRCWSRSRRTPPARPGTWPGPTRPAIGGTKAGALVTTFQEETESDLFGEQAVLCGGVTALVNAGFETLVDAGYQPEVAYFECLHELKLIVDLMYEGGESWMRYSVSDTAEYGDLTRGPRVIGDADPAGHGQDPGRHPVGRVRPRVGGRGRQRPAELRSGCATRPTRPQIEQVGKPLRKMMSWLNAATEEMDG